MFARMPSAIALGLEEAIPDIESSARLFQFGVLRFMHGDKNFEIPDLYAADASFFTLFSYEFIAGDPQTALLDPQTFVLTEDTAIQIFGSVDAVGKSISVPIQQGNQDFHVTGVVKNIPRNSHFRFNIVLSINTFRQRDNDQPAGPDFLNDPIYFNPFTFILLSESADVAEVEQKIAAVVEEKWGELYRKEGITRRYPLQALTDIHLKSNFEAEIAQQGDIQYVYIFSVVAVMVLFIACFNFINLSTARSVKRAKEVGLRKMFGAQRHQLIKQFLNESSLLALLGTLVGILLISLSLPAFNQLSGKEFSLRYLVSAPSIVALLIIIILTGFIAGSFPAFVLSNFQPVTTLRGKLGQTKQSGSFRKILVVFQFSISIFMILGFIVILQQLDYIKNKDLGFDRDHLVIVRGGGRTNDALRDNILKDPHVLSASLSQSIPGEFTGDQSYYLSGKDPASSVRASFFGIDYDFVKTFDMKILWGRDFSREYSTDANDAVILNETFARQLGLGMEIIGKQIIDVSNSEFRPIVIGVIKDFQHQSLKLKINPMILSIEPEQFAFVAARITPQNVSATLEHIETDYVSLHYEPHFCASGVELAWLLPTKYYWRIIAGMLNGFTQRGEDTFYSQFIGFNGVNSAYRNFDDFAYTVSSRRFFQLNQNHSLKIDLSGVFDSPGPDNSRKTQSVAITYKWFPLKNGLYKSLEWSTEVFFNQEKFNSPSIQNTHGVYSYVYYKLNRLFSIGVIGESSLFRYERTKTANHLGAALSYQPSERQRVRLEIGYYDREAWLNAVASASGKNTGDGKFWQAFIQWSAVMGSHIHSYE